jgi:hypothetical protein
MYFVGILSPLTQDIKAILDLILSSTATLGLLASFGIVIWQFRLYKGLMANSDKIRQKQDEIDAVEPDVNRRTSGHLVTEKQRTAQIKVARTPLLRELERLREERQFIKDKLLFAKK